MIWYVLGACRVTCLKLCLSQCIRPWLLALTNAHVHAERLKAHLNCEVLQRLKNFNASAWTFAALSLQAKTCVHWVIKHCFAFHHGGGLFSCPLVRPWDKDTLLLTKGDPGIVWPGLKTSCCGTGTIGRASYLFLTLQVVRAGRGSYETIQKEIVISYKSKKGAAAAGWCDGHARL